MTMHKTQRTPLRLRATQCSSFIWRDPGLKRIKIKPRYSFLGCLLKNRNPCFKLIIRYAVHQHMMPSANRSSSLFFSLHKLYHPPLFICLHWLPSCLLTPRFKLLILCLKTKHNLPAPISAPASPSSQRSRPQPALLWQPLCFCFPAALSCILLASLYTTYIPFLHDFSQRYFTLFSLFSQTNFLLVCFFFILLYFGVNGRD